MTKKLTSSLEIPSIFSSVQKLFFLLTRSEKLQWLGILGFALCMSCLEIVAATIIVIFAQVLNQPEIGIHYLNVVGFKENLTPNHVILYIAVIFGIVYLIKNIVAAIETFYQNFSIQKMCYHFKNKILQRYAEIDYSFYLTRNSSYNAAIVGGDVEFIFSAGMVTLAAILSESIVAFCLVSMIIYMNPSLAIFIFGIGTVFTLVVSKFVLPLFYRWGQHLQEASMQCSQNLYQFFHGFKEIILNGKRDAFINAYQIHARRKARVQAIQLATNALPRMVIEVLFVGLFVVAISYLFLTNGMMQEMMGILGGYLYAAFRLMPALNRIISQTNTFKSAIPAIERVHKEYHLAFEKESYQDIPNFQFFQSLSIHNVSFRYNNSPNDALKNINLIIKRGECIGIVGETGSGKSTLVDLILGLLKPYAGSILCDNQYPVNSYQWHQEIGYVPQSIYLLDDTIEANVAFGISPENIDRVQLTKVIEAAQLTKLIKSLPEDTKTIVGERGIRLSGGERQRIAIARALYRNPDVLIFDEATAALDNETEARLMETIHAISQDRTVIMIAHRLTTLKKCDRVIMMSEGELIDQFEYEELTQKNLKRSNT